MTYGYVRVSTDTQNIDRQMKVMHDYGLRDKDIFVDKESGKDFNRKAYKKLLKKVKENDLIIIKSIDRLGRNYQMIIEEWKTITKGKNVNIKVLDMPLLDTTIQKNLIGNFISDLVLQILSFVSENERNMIKQRQKEGILLAKEKGVKFGRPKKEIPAKFDEVLQRYKRKEITNRKACQILHISHNSFFREIKRRKDKELVYKFFIVIVMGNGNYSFFFCR